METCSRFSARTESHAKRSKINKHLTTRILGIIMLVIFLLGCTPKRYQDISNSISFDPLLTPEGEYKSVTWLDQDRIAFIYRPDDFALSDLNEGFRVGIFDISTGATKDLTSLPITLDCYSKRTDISDLSRVPNGSLGLIFSCRSGGDRLYLLNPDSNEIVERQTFLGFIAGSFSFSPDMSQFVQENSNGGGLSDKLLLVSSDKTIKELLPDFQRARSPAWSSDGATIAFAGTKENKELTSEQDIETLFFYPWDIYLMNADGSNPRILLPVVGIIYDLKWSPTNEKLLLFGGNSFDHVPGIWLFDTEKMSVKRIWKKNSLFDWSPDGSKIVFLDNATDVWWRSIKIINLATQ